MTATSWPERVATVLVVRATGEDGAATADQALDLAGDPLGLLFLVVGLEALDRQPRPAFAVQSFLSLRAALLRDDRVGGVEDQLRRAVVLLELHDRRVREVALEVEDVAEVRAAPGVDRLVVVADDAQVAVRSRPGRGPTGTAPGSCPGTRRRGGSASAPGTAPGRPGAWSNRRTASQQEVVEVERARPRAGAADSDRRAGRSIRSMVVDRVVGQERRVEHLVLRPADRARAPPRAELAGGRQVVVR